MRIREFEAGIFMEWGLFFGLTKHKLMLKNRLVVGSIFGWSLMIIGEEAPDFLKEWLFVGWQFGRGIIPW